MLGGFSHATAKRPEKFGKSFTRQYDNINAGLVSAATIKATTSSHLVKCEKLVQPVAQWKTDDFCGELGSLFERIEARHSASDERKVERRKSAEPQEAIVQEEHAAKLFEQQERHREECRRRGFPAL
ncbi:hypothetical protein CYMTET_18212 [Cymbomonas tetramitiformis]|uniref:Uncharacterized protein n=1 Tax=Cymbomonas tetramitiformis TaxID=36881 RepID=A0AAE0G8K4_9CHLO|nr:hypothetical protein CYMTET_18212 [Cymbomonas tetramitiformis]